MVIGLFKIISFQSKYCIPILHSFISLAEIGFPFANILRKKGIIFAFVALHFCAKNSILCNHSRISFRAQLHYFVLRYSVLRYSVLRYSVLCYSVFRNFAEHFLIKRLIKGVIWILWDCTFWHKIAMLKNETDYLHKTLFCNLMHDRTLQNKLCTLSHKNRTVFCQLLLLNLR